VHTGIPTPLVAIIGAAGFIGRRLTSALAAHAEVATYTRERSFMQGADLTPPLRTADVVFYLATSINPALGERHPEWAAADHRRFARLLHELALLESPPTVVLTSSGGTVYDPSAPLPYTEQSPTRATCLYAAAKLAAEGELAERAGVIPSVILRLSNIYGPGQRAGKDQGVLAYWLAAAARRETLRVIGDPDSTRDYLYIDDVTACMCLVFEAVMRRPGLAASGPLTLNVGSGGRTSLAELIEVVQSLAEGDLPVEMWPARRLDRPHVWLDSGKANRVLGWRPQTRLADGVAAMWHELGGRTMTGTHAALGARQAAAPGAIPGQAV
jgi:UDP-glucose 4-epimerase